MEVSRIALDPVTAALITNAAKKLLKDQETRNRLLILSVVPFAVVVFIIALIFYLLTLPFSWLGGMFDLGERLALEQMRQNDRYAALEEVYYEYMDGYNTYGGIMSFPCEGFNITNPYGPWFNPILNKIDKHTGIDMQPAHHAEIYAVYDGEVIRVNTSTNAYGNYVVLRHELDGVVIYTVYAHLSEVHVDEGDDDIEQGDVIGLEGGGPGDPNPGRSTGHHLHFEVRKAPTYGNDVDPYPYLFPL